MKTVRLYRKDGMVAEVTQTDKGVWARKYGKGLITQESQKPIKFNALPFEMIVGGLILSGYETPKRMAKMETIRR